MAGIVLPYFAGRNSGGAAPVQGIRQVTFGGTNGVLWPQKYNLLDNSCKAGQYAPGHIYAPKICRQSVMCGNAQHKTVEYLYFRSYGICMLGFHHARIPRLLAVRRLAA